MHRRLLGFVTRRAFSVAAFFWVVFALTYHYRELIDDGRYLPVVQGQTLRFAGEYFRPLTSLTLFLPTWLGAIGTPQNAYFISILLHVFAVGWLAWRFLLPLLPDRGLAACGLLVWLVHPASLHTVVHVAQRGEIVGLAIGVIAIWLFLRMENHWLVALTTLPALLAKESAAVIPLVLTLVMALTPPRETASGANSGNRLATFAPVAIALILCFWGAAQNPFSGDRVQNGVNHRNSIEFRKSVAAGVETPAQFSTILPIRTRSENALFQTAILPEAFKILLAPTRISQDLGHFPWGRETVEHEPIQAVLGLGLLTLLLAALSARLKKQPLRSSDDRRLLAFGLVSVAASLGVFWLFPVYDAFLAYRFYQPAFLVWVVILPIVFRQMPRFFLLIAAIAFAAGIARVIEIQDPLSAAQTELARQPYHFRNYTNLARAAIDSASRTSGGASIAVDCDSILRPALTLAPSAALIEIEWAYCARAQGRLDEARAHALRSLQFDSVPENVHVAVTYLMGPDGRMQVPEEQIHPNNLGHLSLKSTPKR